MLARRHSLAFATLLLFALLCATTLRAAHLHADGDGHPAGKDAAHCSICLSFDRSSAPPTALRSVRPPLVDVVFRVLPDAANATSPLEIAGAHRPRGPPVHFDC